MAGKFVTLMSVGVHAPGEVIEFTKDHIEKLGVDVERLLHIGAIREATGDEAKRSTSYGTPGDVDHAALAGALAADPLRGESPPTLPREGFPNEARPVGGTVSDRPEPAKKG